jgi:GDSL-like lipase/acylhydrolase family protein
MKKLSLRINWKYLLFLSVFIIICLEIFGRAYLSLVLEKSPRPKFQFDSYRIYSHVPYFHEGDGKKDWIVINGQGFRRNTNVAKTKAENTIRIFLMGGSAAHGISTAPPYPLVHIYMDQTIDYYLEQKLQSNYPGRHIEVINAAVTGYQVFQHTAYILTELLDYDPDLIIFLDGANDHYFNNPDFDYFGSNRYQFWKPRLQNASLGGLADYAFLWMSHFSGFARGYYYWRLNRDASSYDAVANRSIIKYSDPNALIEGHKVAAERMFLRSIATNISILQAHGIDVIICLQPMLVLRKADLLSKAEKDFMKSDDNVTALYPAVTSELSELAAKNNVPFIDLIPEFNKDEYRQQQLLIDYCHLSPLGAQVVANRLVAAVDAVLAKRLNK